MISIPVWYLISLHSIILSIQIIIQLFNSIQKSSLKLSSFSMNFEILWRFEFWWSIINSTFVIVSDSDSERFTILLTTKLQAIQFFQLFYSIFQWVVIFNSKTKSWTIILSPYYTKIIYNNVKLILYKCIQTKILPR